MASSSRRVVQAVLVVLSGVPLTGCFAGESELRTRSAFDLRCPEPELQIVDLGGRTRGVTGCGKRATYVWVQNGQYAGDWVLNSDEHPHK